MKKQLLAMAVAATFAAPAMAQQVTVSGTLDISPVSQTKTKIETEQRNASDTTTGGNWATSLINFQATEDLGGGLKATAFVNQVVNATTGEFTARDRWIEISGGMGAVKAGRFSPALEAGYSAYAVAGTTNSAGSSDSSAYDLLVGSFGYTNSFSRSTSTTTITANRTTLDAAFDIAAKDAGRQQGIIQFVTPSFSGLKATVEMIANSLDSDATTRAGEAETKQSALRLDYAAGPLSVSAAHGKRSVKREAAGASSSFLAANGAVNDATTVYTSAATGTGLIIAGTQAVLQRKVESSIFWLGASYKVGAATVLYSYATRKDEMSADNAASIVQADVKVQTIGVRMPVGAFTVTASAYNGEDDRAAASGDEVDLKGHQLGVTYNLSKRTYAYGVMGVNKTDSATAASNTKREQTNFGLVHTF
jgi:predicted porin